MKQLYAFYCVVIGVMFVLSALPAHGSDSITYLRDLKGPVRSSDSVTFAEGAHTYKIDGRGVIKRLAEGKVAAQHNLNPDEKKYSLIRAFVGAYKGSLIVYYELSNPDDSFSVIICLEPLSLTRKWSLEAGAFNGGPFAITGSSLYYATFDVTGRIDLDKGRQVWKNEGLYAKYEFNSCTGIEFLDTTIRFSFTDGGGRTKPSHVLEVSKESGKIVKK